VDPAQVIERPDLSLFLQQFKRYYRYVILDCPPALLCPEPITLSTIADGTLLVARAWHTDKRLVRDAATLLDGEKMLGVVMNEGMDPVGSYLEYGYHGYYATGDTRNFKARAK
jgi:Mrp family chromosome partitioning ATPase